jgi:DNA-directed RNA polymerase subunit M/transcription elongation factor TFIIS
MIAEIGAGLSSAKTLMDIVKGLNAANTQVQINAAKIALQEQIMEIQNALFAASTAGTTSNERVRELEEEITRLADWETEKRRYELKSVDGGTFAYMPRSGVENGEDAHWLCTNCFERGRKSIMQYQGPQRPKDGPVTDMYQCNSCNGTMAVHFRIRPKYIRSMESA